VGYFVERSCDDWQRIYLIKGIIERKNHSVARKYSGMKLMVISLLFSAENAEEIQREMISKTPPCSMRCFPRVLCVNVWDRY
jgi:hypothetical protein